MPTNALIYARRSRKPGASSERSVTEQENECRALCAREGWAVLDVITDNNLGASRHSGKARPGWAKVKRTIGAGGVDVLVMWEQSRGQRDVEEWAGVRNLLRAHGTLWNYSGRTIDLDNPGDAMASGIQAVVDEHEAEQLRKRVMRSQRAQAHAGRPHGRRPFGYRRVYDTNTAALVGQVPDEAEADIVREVFDRIVRHESARGIADDLAARGVPSSASGRQPWTAARVRDVVTNPTYAGQRVHQGVVMGDADWPALVSPEVYAAANAIYADPSRKRVKRGNVVHLLSGIPVCGKCGARMRADSVNGRTMYVCKDGKGHLGRTAAMLDDYVEVAVVERLESMKLTWVPEGAGNGAAARAEVAALRAQRDALADQYMDGKLSAAMLGTLEARLLIKIAEAEERAHAAPTTSPLLAEVSGPGAAERWDALDIGAKREVVRAVVDVTVLPDERRRGMRGLNPDAIRLGFKVSNRP
jgi:site-specific DNA recombinase